MSEIEEKLESALKIADVTLIPEVDQFKDPSSGLVRCILDSTSMAYQLEYWGGKYIGKDVIVERVSEELEKSFTRDVYNNLLGGAMVESSKRCYERAKRSISSPKGIEFGVQEYLSDMYNIDIILLYDNAEKLKVDRRRKEHTYYHRGRDTIIVLFHGNVYYLVAIETNNGYVTLFHPESEFVRNLK